MGRILVGISAWSDRSLVQSGFYPDEVRTPGDRLRYYGQEFPVAEIDSSYHFLPTRGNLELWLDSTPEDFTFDVKAFSLFTLHPTPFSSLPRGIRDSVGHLAEHKGNLYPRHLPAEALDALWHGFARSLEAIGAAGKLRAVLFQFPPWFHPSAENLEYIVRNARQLRRMLGL
jgi:uncharacterized protein YecE (DUF72 family)